MRDGDFGSGDGYANACFADFIRARWRYGNVADRAKPCGKPCFGDVAPSGSYFADGCHHGLFGPKGGHSRVTARPCHANYRCAWMKETKARVDPSLASAD